MLLPMFALDMSALNDSRSTSPGNSSAGVSPGRHPRVLCCGDSLTAGFFGDHSVYQPYAKKLAELLGVPVDEIGCSGARAEEMVANMLKPANQDVFGKQTPGLLQQLGIRDYTVCIIMAGTNDVNSGRSADAIFADVHRLHSVCHERGLRTVALPIPESQFVKQPQNGHLAGQRLAFNQRLEQWASAKPDRMLFVDMASQMPFSHTSGDWARDGLHMSMHGYSNFAIRLSLFVRSFILGTTSPLKQSALRKDQQVRYKRSTGESVSAKVVGPSPKGPEYLMIEYKVFGQMMRNLQAPVAAIASCEFERGH